MKTIHKYVVPYHGRVVLPSESTILSVGIKEDEMVVWALVDTDTADESTKEILVVGTGRELPEDIDKFKFLGTVFENGFVWHTFEVVR